MMVSEEIFKDIQGFEGLYQIGNKGTVRSLMFRNNNARLPKIKNLKATDNGRGYLVIALSNNGTSKNFYVHRLVAMAFITRENTKNVVNHKDHNTHNNCVENLEWCTPKENVAHSKDRMRHPKTKSKTTNTGEKYIRRYMSHNKYFCYRLVIKPLKISKQFRTLEEAVLFRDEVMQNV